MTRSMLLHELLPELEGLSAELAITGLVQDSREVKPGNAFVAMLPARQEVPSSHGMHFVQQAVDAGAVAILYEPPAPDDVAVPDGAIAVPGLQAKLGELADRFHGHPSAAMAMVGVTGTNGKTSTVQLLAQAWTLRGQQVGTIGTLGAGIWPNAVPTGFTTPLVLQMHALLAQFGLQALAATRYARALPPSVVS